MTRAWFRTHSTTCSTASAAATTEEGQAQNQLECIKQWMDAIQYGLNEEQMKVYMVRGAVSVQTAAGASLGVAVCHWVCLGRGGGAGRVQAMYQVVSTGLPPKNTCCSKVLQNDCYSMMMLNPTFTE
jgi:hypothetical protein